MGGRGCGGKYRHQGGVTAPDSSLRVVGGATDPDLHSAASPLKKYDRFFLGCLVGQLRC